MNGSVPVLLKESPDIQGEGEVIWTNREMTWKGNAMCSHDATINGGLAWQLGAECERGADERAVQRAGECWRVLPSSTGSMFVPSNAIDSGFDFGFIHQYLQV